MAIVDFWNNQLLVNNGNLIGYTSEAEDFPHDIYSFYLSSIRNNDQENISLLYRWLRPMQLYWRSQNIKINSVKDLLSPEKCPIEYIQYLGNNIGIWDDLAYIWRYLNNNEKRIFIKFFTRFIRYRYSSFGVDDMLIKMSGETIDIQDFFYFRWLVSGESEFDLETAIGREDDGYDPWLLSELDVPVGVIPDKVEIKQTPSLEGFYYFTIDSLVAAITNPPTPQVVFAKCLLTGKTIIENLQYNISLDEYFISLPVFYFFEQSELNLSEEESSFRVWFEPDPYVSDILIHDTGEIDRDVLIGLVKFSRPNSERIYIRYYKLIEKFVNDENWTSILGTNTFSDGEVLIGDGAIVSVLELIYLDSAIWVDYSVTFKSKCGVVDKFSEIRFMVQDNNNYYYFRFTPSDPPTIPAGTWSVGKVVASVDTVLDSGGVDWLDINVDYIWRVVCNTSERPGGDVQIIKVFQDENVVVDIVDDPLSWVDTFGTVQFVQEAAGTLAVSKVNIHLIPLESSYVGV